MKNLILAATLLLLSGCYYTMIPADKPVRIAFYQVEPQIAWNKFTITDGTTEQWTVDGHSLQSLNFVSGIADGKPMRKPAYNSPVEDMPLFRSSMTPSEIEEFVVDTFARLGFADVVAAGLSPARFGYLDGFRFSLSMLTPTGLEFDGLAIGAVKDEKLFMIIYTGARRYYFPKYRADVERLFDSIRSDEQAPS